MTFTANVLNQSDANGQISWTFAHCLTNLHGISTAEFLAEYAALEGERVDAGEFLSWLGY